MKADMNNANENFIFVKSDLALYRIDFDDLYFIEGHKDYILLHTSANTFKVHTPMKDIEKTLPQKDFVRVHKSYIVRIDKIAYVRYPNIMIQDKMKLLQIGATYKENVFKQLNVL